jgi:hypothetical protein
MNTRFVLRFGGVFPFITCELIALRNLDFDPHGGWSIFFIAMECRAPALNSRLIFSHCRRHGVPNNLIINAKPARIFVNGVTCSQ